MATYEDIHCQWCKGVIGVANDKQVLHVSNAQVDALGKFYHDSPEKKCWSSLVNMTAFVEKNFKAG